MKKYFFLIFACLTIFLSVGKQGIILTFEEDFPEIDNTEEII